MHDNRPLDVVQTLADHLAERTRVVGRGTGPPRAEFVLYWLHHAMRAYENPALGCRSNTGESAGASFAGVPSDPRALSVRFGSSPPVHARGSSRSSGAVTSAGHHLRFPPGPMQRSGSALTRTLSARRCGDHGRDAGGTIAELDRSTRVYHEPPPSQRRYGLRRSHADRPHGVRPSL